MYLIYTCLIQYMSYIYVILYLQFPNILDFYNLYIYFTVE